MGRSHRGAGPPPARRSRFAHLLFGREREIVRARVVSSFAVAAAVAVALALFPQRDLHAPVLDVVEAEAPDLELEHMSALVSAPPPPVEPIFEPVDPGMAGLDPNALAGAVSAVRQEVRRGRIPGAALVVGRGSRVVEKHGIGRLAPGLGNVDPDETIYDLASLTKVVATTAAVMLLVEDGRMELDAPVRRYLPEFSGGAKDRVTIRHLLTHTSGLPAGRTLPGDDPDAAMRRLITTPLRTRPGQRVVYSDIGPIVLFAAAERAAGEPLDRLLERRIYGPLGMRSTGFNPAEPCDRCAPTTRAIRGFVHDPIAQRLGGVAGNAGLFSTATDLGRFAAMLANGGELEGIRIFREETVRVFAARQEGADDRALGWETPGRRRRSSAGSAGALISERAFGHTGFTGTSLWIDPDRGTWVVLLSNRTYDPRAPNRMQALRRAVHDQIAEAVDVAVAD